MIRGPVLPQSRESLWSLVVGRLESIEHGLTLVSEGFDCSDGQLGIVEALARDAVGAPVLILLAMEGDPLLAARAFGALDFLRRVGDALVPAVPEGEFCPGSRGRVIVIGVDRHAAACEQLIRSASAGLQVCRLEPFRVGGSERFAARWLTAAEPAPVAGESAAAPFAVPRHLQAVWQGLHDLCLRIDAGIKIEGDRYHRRISWNGHVLAEVHVAEGALHGKLPDGSAHVLAAPPVVRSFCDQVLRGHAQLVGLVIRRGDSDGPPPVAERGATLPQAGIGQGGRARPSRDSLRSVAAASRLTPEEYNALGGPTPEVGSGVEGAATADDVARIVAAQEGSWPLPGRPD